MANTIREQIILAIIARVAEIRTANGYNTDCGANALRVKKLVDPDDLPIVTVWPQPEERTKEYGKFVCNMPIKIECIKAYGSTNPSIVAESMLGDIIENILGVEWTLPFTTGATEIEVGDTVVGATSAATAYVVDVDVDTGTWGGGDAAGDLLLRRKVGTFQAENLKVSGEVVAATTGVITGTSAIANATNSLADSIDYMEGGTEEYPDDKNISVGASATFSVKYSTNIGDPYNNN